MYIEHLRIPVGAGALHVERVGRAGKPIVLLHGFGTSAFLWRHVQPALAEAGFTTLAVDLMGYGESDRPVDAAYGIPAQAEYLDLALTALRLPKAVIVGQDLGAIVALQLAARRPERVERLVLVNPLDPSDLPGSAIRSLQRAAARVALGSHGLFGAWPLLASLLKEGVAEEAGMPDLLVARYLAPFVGSDGVSHLLQLARSLEFEDEDELRLRAVQAPALLIRGALDNTTSAALFDAFAASLGGDDIPQIRVFHDASRLVSEDTPAELASAIREWANVSDNERVVEVLQAAERRSES